AARTTSPWADQTGPADDHARWARTRLGQRASGRLLPGTRRRTGPRGPAGRDVSRGWRGRSCRHLRPHSLGLGARERLEALDDHVRVERIELHQVRLALSLVRRDQRAAAAAEQVEDVLAS